jgi:hypothetical protein
MAWENVAQYKNPNSCWQLWKSFYLQILDRLHACIIQMHDNPRQLTSLDYSKHQKSDESKRCSQNKAVKFSNKVNSELYKARKSYFCDKFEDCAQNKDPKQS